MRRNLFKEEAIKEYKDKKTIDGKKFISRDKIESLQKKKWF